MKLMINAGYVAAGAAIGGALRYLATVYIQHRAGPGGQDGAHIGGAEPFERHRPVQRRHQGVGAVSGTQRQQYVQFRRQSAVADGRGPDEELLGAIA